MKIMRALGLCTYYLKSICISVSRFDRKLGALDPIVGDLLKNRSYFLWAIGIFLLSI